MAQSPTPWRYLTRRRIRAGHTQTSLAAAVQVYVSTICRIEQGTRGVSPQLCKRLAEALQVDIDELIDSAPTPPAQTPPAQTPPRESVAS